VPLLSDRELALAAEHVQHLVGRLDVLGAPELDDALGQQLVGVQAPVRTVVGVNRIPHRP